MSGSLRAAWHRLRGWRRSHAREQEMLEEIASHLDLLTAELARGGLEPAEARRQAQLRLGADEAARQAYRERDSLPLLADALRDVRYALRQLARDPGFALAVVAVLALGMAGCIGLFDFADAALLQPLPYRLPGRLVAVNETSDALQTANLSYPDYLDLGRATRTLASLDAWEATGWLLETGHASEPVRGTRVTGGFFRTLGVAPILGRSFRPGEDQPGAGRTVILNYSSWQRRFRARRDIIGRVLLLSGEPYTVIGVMPERFSFAPRGRGEFWVPYQAGEGCDQQRGCHSLNGVGRLRDGSTAAQARSELQSLAAELARQYPDTNRGRGVRVVSLADSFVADYRPVLLALFAAACLLLLIACVNVCGLLLVRAESRRREMAVRAALGASPLRLARQLVTESLVPTGLGCLLALALSLALVRLLTTLVPQHMRNGMPFLECLGLNRHVALFAAALTAGAAGLMAASLLLRLPLRRLGEALAAGGRGSSGTTWRRLGARMVVVELALATLLLAGSGLLGRSLIRLLHVKLGFEPRHLAAMEVDSAAARSGDGGDHTAEFDRDLLRRLEAVPGVRSAALSSVLPVSYNSNTDWLRFVGQPWHGEHNESLEREVTPGYFRTLGAGLLRGRAFTDQDDGVHPRVAIINHSLAQRYFPGKDPVGRQVGGLDLAPGSIKTIIGVVEDIHEGPLDEAVWPAIYYPMAQAPDSSVRVLVRTEGSPEAMLPALSAAVRGIGRGVGTLDPETMTSRIADSPSVYLRRSAAWVTGGFAALSALLAGIGLYGLVAYSVGQRSRELAMRLALGARPGAIYRLVGGEAARLAATGLLLGLGLYAGAHRLLGGLLFAVSGWDLPTLLAVVVLLGCVALVAGVLPARRAAAIHPAEALRAE